MKIDSALNSLKTSKAHGPDGLNDAFIKDSRDFLKPEFLQMANEFHASGNLPKGFNSSILTLIPKNNSPKDASEFRPISLINFSMKVLLKVLDM